MRDDSSTSSSARRRWRSRVLAAPLRALAAPDRARRPRPPRSTAGAGREQTARADSPASPDACARSRRRTRRRAALSRQRLLRQRAVAGRRLLRRAFSVRRRADRDSAERLLQWLKQEYPTSPLVKRVDGALQALRQAPARRRGAEHSPPPATTRITPPASPPAPTTLPASTPAAVRERHHAASLPHGERITIEFSEEVAFTGDRVDEPGPRVLRLRERDGAPRRCRSRAAPSGRSSKAVRIGAGIRTA